MEPRMNYAQIDPDVRNAMMHLERYVRQSGLDPKMLELVKIRASQINGCAFCIDMHTIDARAAGETEQRLYLLNAWRESPFYSDAERAALELTETLTQISTHHVSDELYARVREHFSEKQYIQLVMAINTINSWNRLSIATGALPGTYQPPQKKGD